MKIIPIRRPLTPPGVDTCEVHGVEKCFYCSRPVPAQPPEPIGLEPLIFERPLFEPTHGERVIAWILLISAAIAIFSIGIGLAHVLEWLRA